VGNERLVVGATLLFVASVSATQCTRSANPSATTDHQPSTTSPQVPASTPQALIGQPITPVVSVKELMQYMIDPVADNIFDAVWWDTTKAGVVKHEPKTQDDWDRVRTGAVSLAEGIELLKVPRPWTPPGDVNNSTGPNPPELSPTQIQAKLDGDPVLWEAKIQALRNAALEIVELAKKKDTDALFSASEDVNEACEACHLEYWYPGDAAAVREWKNAKVRFDKPAPAPSHK
jgi:Cytochrome C'